MLLALLFFVLSPLESDTITAKVTKVTDGDTMHLLSDGKKIIIRLHGVDSPDKCQDQFQEAKVFATESLLGQTVTFIQTDTDRFERSVGELYLSSEKTDLNAGVWFNKLIVEKGYAWHWPKYSNSPLLKRAQEQAKRSRVGVWQQANPMPPWEYRQTEKYKNCKATQ